MNNKLTIAALAVMIPLAASPAAHARDWSLLNHATRSCDDATLVPVGNRSPYEMEMTLRRFGTYVGTEVVRDSAGGVAAADVTGKDDGGPTHMIYFADADVCRDYASKVFKVKKGELE